MNTAHRQHSLAMGGFKEFLLLFAPIFVITFSNGIYFLFEKLLLARLSVTAMEVAVNASNAVQIFQAPCISLVMMAQVYVSRWHGSKENHLIGPGIWQLIWFSLLTNFIIIPCGFVYGAMYFAGTSFEDIAVPYFNFLTIINFLYPLGATLACFHLALGKSRLVVIVTVVTQCLKLLLGYILIFGWSFIPSLGLTGGILSTLIAQGTYCVILGLEFLKKPFAEQYNTKAWAFRPALFWECVYPGGLRALNRILSIGSWTAVVHLMTIRGGDYLLVFSVGGTLALFLPFLADAICQTQTIIVSRLLGAKNYLELNRTFFVGVAIVIIFLLLISLPLLVFPRPVFNYLFPMISFSDEMIRNIFAGVWISFSFFTFAFIPIAYVLAFKDTKFSFWMGIFNWINGYLLMYFLIEKVGIAADQFWLCLSLMHGSNAVIYYFRMKWLQSKAMEQSLLTD